MRLSPFLEGSPYARANNTATDEIRMQSRVYGVQKEDVGLFSYIPYEKVGLPADYKTKLLVPFMNLLKRTNPEPVVVDLGAGLGAAAEEMEKEGAALVIRADVNEEGLRGQKNAVRATAWQLPFKNASVTGVHMKDAITHIAPEFRPNLFAEIERVLVPNGKALIVGSQEVSQKKYQYATFEKALVRSAASNGLALQSAEDWQPSSSIGDWYHDRRKRFVLLLAKPPHSAESNSDIVRP